MSDMPIFGPLADVENAVNPPCPKHDTRSRPCPYCAEIPEEDQW